MLISVAISLGMLYQVPAGPSVVRKETVVAEIAEDRLTEDMVYRHIRNTFGDNQLPPSTMAVYVPLLIRQMIADRAIAYEAERMGFTISDAEVRRQIRAIPMFANLSPDEEKDALLKMGYTIEEFERDFRKNALENMLENEVADAVTVTDEETQNAYREANTKIKLQYVVFAEDQYEKAKEAADMLAKNGGDIDAVAKSFGLEAKTSEPFTRSGSFGGTMGAGQFTELFSKAVGATMGPVIAGGKPVVLKLVEKIEADMQGLAAQRAAIAIKVRDKKLQVRKKSFEDSILEKLSKERKIKFNPDVVDRITSKYQKN